jgi:hypothetical protein
MQSLQRGCHSRYLGLAVVLLGARPRSLCARSWGQSHNSNILIRVSPEHPAVACVGPHVFWFSVNWKNQV